ncbi:MAG: glycoside hydrolase family 11 protein, partial [Fibromonadales bacterium]|nr:glycoside hydrolase family 11 protein [Fibromonadales bacterium]
MMKKLAIALCLAITFALPTVVLADETKTTSTTWTYKGYDCELWSENNQGTTSMTVNGDDGTGANAKGGTFTASWSNTKNILFRCGRKFATTSGGNISGRDPAKPAADYGNISINFAATWSSSDNVKMLGVYGWAFYAQGSIPSNYDKAIEYYIIQDRGSYNSATQGTNSTKKGS